MQLYQGPTSSPGLRYPLSATNEMFARAALWARAFGSGSLLTMPGAGGLRQCSELCDCAMHGFEFFSQLRHDLCELIRGREFLDGWSQHAEVLANSAGIEIRPSQIGNHVGGSWVLLHFALSADRCDRGSTDMFEVRPVAPTNRTDINDLSLHENLLHCRAAEVLSSDTCVGDAGLWARQARMRNPKADTERCMGRRPPGASESAPEYSPPHRYKSKRR